MFLNFFSISVKNVLGLTTSLNIVISNYFHKSCMQLYVKVSEIWCTSSVSLPFSFTTGSVRCLSHFPRLGPLK